MKKYVLFFALLTYCGLNASSQKLSDFYGRWQIQSFENKGQLYEKSKKNELYKLLMEESKIAALKEDSVFSVEDSLDAVKDCNETLAIAFNVEYNFKPVNKVDMELNGVTKPIKVSGTFSYNPKNNKLTVVGIVSPGKKKIENFIATFKDGFLYLKKPEGTAKFSKL